MNVGAGGLRDFPVAIKQFQRGFEDLIWGGIVFQVIPDACRPPSGKQIPANCFRDCQFAPDAGDMSLLGQITTVQTAPEQAACTVDEHAGKQLHQLWRFGITDLSELVAFLQSIPCVAKEVVDIGDGNVQGDVILFKNFCH